MNSVKVLLLCFFIYTCQSVNTEQKIIFQSLKFSLSFKLSPKIILPKENRDSVIKNLLRNFKIDSINNNLNSKQRGIVYAVQSDSDTIIRLYLTLDLCDVGYDSLLINYLIDNTIPATFFVTSKWIKHQKKQLQTLLKHKQLFDFQNHGWKHRPLSLCGYSKFNIKGTKNLQDLISEVENGAKSVEETFGNKVYFFRSGTAFCDAQSVLIVNALGYEIVNYSISLDSGGTIGLTSIVSRLKKAKNGNILLLHANKPQSSNFNAFKSFYEDVKSKHTNIRFESLISMKNKLVKY